MKTLLPHHLQQLRHQGGAWLTRSARQVPRAGTHAATLVARLNQYLNQCLLGRDATAAARLYADGFVLTSGSRQQGKGDILSELTDPARRLDHNETTDVTVSVHGTTAVLTGRQHQRGHHQGRAFSCCLLVTHTWMLCHGTWQLLASHLTEARP